MQAFYPTVSPEAILLVSIGTGKVEKCREVNNGGILDWLLKANLVDMIMGAERISSKELTNLVYGANYHRIQVTLTNVMAAMDDPTDENLQGLLTAAEEYIQTHNDVITDLCKKLSRE